MKKTGYISLKNGRRIEITDFHANEDGTLVFETEEGTFCEGDAPYYYVTEIERVNPSTTKKYVVACHKFAVIEERQFSAFNGTRHLNKFQSIADNIHSGYLLGKDLNPTRDMAEALVLEYQFVDDRHGYWGNRGNVLLNGLTCSLLELEKAEEFLLTHPEPRKPISKSTRIAVYEKYGGRCAYCGCPIIDIKEMQVDHLVSHMFNGGEDTLENYMPACEVCNRVKSAYTLEEFRKQIHRCGEIHRNRKTPIDADSDKIARYYGLTEEDREVTFYFEKEETK